MYNISLGAVRRKIQVTNRRKVSTLKIELRRRSQKSSSNHRIQQGENKKEKEKENLDIISIGLDSSGENGHDGHDHRGFQQHQRWQHDLAGIGGMFG